MQKRRQTAEAELYSVIIIGWEHRDTVGHIDVAGLVGVNSNGESVLVGNLLGTCQARDCHKLVFLL